MTETRLRQARLLQRRGLRETAHAGGFDHTLLLHAERGENRSLRVLGAAAEVLDLKDLKEAISTIRYWTEPLNG
jgi:hypothetical protein